MAEINKLQGAIFNDNSRMLAYHPSEQNLFVGDAATVDTVLVGAGNVAVGWQSLNDLSTGYYNTAVGRNALAELTIGQDNVAIGNAASYSVVSYWQTIGIGAYSGPIGAAATSIGYNTRADAYSVSLGSLAYSSADGSGSYNVSIGASARNLATSGINNVAIGSFSGYQAPTGSNNIFLGYSSGYYESGSDKLYITTQAGTDETTGIEAALVYGVMDADTANQVLRINARTGINISPDNDLHIRASRNGGGLSISGDSGTAPGITIFDTTTIATAVYAMQNILVLAPNDGADGTDVGSYIIVNKKNFPIHFATNDKIDLTINPSGLLHLTTVAYETMVLDDNDIPNKKYVDDKLTDSTAGRVEIIVNTETEFESAYALINNNSSGGIIRIGSAITLTKDHSFSHENMIIECDYNVITFGTYSIHVISDSCYYNNGFFDGSGVPFTFTTGTSASTSYVFYNCRYNNFLTSGNRIIFDAAGVIGSFHLILDQCWMTDSASDIRYTVFQVNVSGNTEFADITITDYRVSSRLTQSKVFGFVGTQPQSGLEIIYDGSVILNNTLEPTAITETHSNNKLYQPDGTNPFVYTDDTGKLHIDGDIIQNGSIYETHVEQIYTTKDTIIMRDGAVSGLLVGEYSGIVAKLYDGVTDGQLVFDKDGWARVGDVGNLQKLATIEESSTNTGIAFYDSTTNQLNTNSTFVFTGTRLGLGTATPDELLEVGSNQDARTAVLVSNLTAGASSSAALSVIGEGNAIYVESYSGSHSTRALENWVYTTAGSTDIVLGVATGEVLRITSDRNTICVGTQTAVNFIPTSDLRLKDEVNYDLSSISIDGLKPASFKIKDHFRYGFIAQDMLETHPTLVLGTGVEDKKGKIDYYRINESSIISLLVKEVQELKEEVIKLKNK